MQSKDSRSLLSMSLLVRPTPLDDDQALAQTTRVLVAAAAQIIATVRPPMDTAQEYAPAMYVSAPFGIAVDIDASAAGAKTRAELCALQEC